jgi:hypothetical protein
MNSMVFCKENLKAIKKNEKEILILLAEYEKVQDAAWAEYEKVQSPALAEYEKVQDAALTTFLQKVRQIIDNEKQNKKEE